MSLRPIAPVEGHPDQELPEIDNLNGDQIYEQRGIPENNLTHLNPPTNLVGTARQSSNYAPPLSRLQWDMSLTFEVFDCGPPAKLNESEI